MPPRAVFDHVTRREFLFIFRRSWFFVLKSYLLSAAGAPAREWRGGLLGELSNYHYVRVVRTWRLPTCLVPTAAPTCT